MTRLSKQRQAPAARPRATAPRLATWLAHLALKLSWLRQRLDRVLTGWRQRHSWILNITAKGLYLWRGRISTSTFYPASETGLALFQTWLAATPHRNCRLLVDDVPELYTTERLAKLVGLDRQAVLERHRQRHFPNKRFSTAISLGKSAQYRQEAMLFTALDDQGQTGRWLDALEINQVPLVGIWTPSQLLPSLLAPLGQLPGRCLVFSRHGDYVRGSYLMLQQVRFSRLTLIEPYALSARIAEQLPTLLNYVYAQRWLQKGESLPIYIIAHPSQRQLFQEALSRFATLKIEFIDLHRLARFHRLALAPVDDDCTPLMRHLLIAGSPRAQYANRALRYHYFRRRWQWLLRTTMVATCIVCVAASVWQYRLANRLQSQAVTLSQQTERLQKTAGNIAELPDIPADIDWLKRTVDRKAALEKRQESGRELWAVVFRALKNTAGVVVIDQLTWHNDPNDSDMLQLEGRINLPTPATNSREAEATFLLFRKMLGDDYVVTVLKSPLQGGNTAETSLGKSVDGNDGYRFAISLRSSRL